MGDERVDQRAVLVAGGGVDDQAGGFVEDKKMAVLVQYRERDGFALRRGGGGRRDGDGVDGAGADFLRSVCGDGAVAGDSTLQDQIFDARSGQVGDLVAQDLVEALAGIRRAGFDDDGSVCG